MYQKLVSERSMFTFSSGRYAARSVEHAQVSDLFHDLFLTPLQGTISVKRNDIRQFAHGLISYVLGEGAILCHCASNGLYVQGIIGSFISTAALALFLVHAYHNAASYIPEKRTIVLHYSDAKYAGSLVHESVHYFADTEVMRMNADKYLARALQLYYVRFRENKEVRTKGFDYPHYPYMCGKRHVLSVIANGRAYEKSRKYIEQVNYLNASEEKQVPEDSRTGMFVFGVVEQLIDSGYGHRPVLLFLNELSQGSTFEDALQKVLG